MKLFALLLNLYILLLPLVPCADYEVCEEKNSHQLSADHKNSRHEEKACTPFCNCGCCPATVFTKTGNNEMLIEEKPPSSKAMYTLSFSSFDFHSIWQPPKLG